MKILNTFHFNKGNVTIAVSNNLFNADFQVEVAAASSILNVDFYNVNDSTLWKTDLEYTVKYESMGLPSCALVKMTSGKILYENVVGTFGDATQCKNLFKGKQMLFKPL